jgi:four helix bundle protein
MWMDSSDLRKRVKGFAIRVIRVVVALPRSPVGDVLGKQLLRSGTSVGANYREACRGRSKAEFAAKAAICAQEADESLYWLELLVDSGLVRRPLLADLQQEANELVAIFTASVKTARRNDRKPDPPAE